MPHEGVNFAVADYQVSIRAADVLARARPSAGRLVSGHLPASGTGPIRLEVDFTGWPATLRVSYRQPLANGWSSHESWIWLLATNPTFGGIRWWLVCPACGLRRGVLYLDPEHHFPWACRQCRRLAYHSQRESPEDRLLRRLKKILQRAGGAYNLRPLTSEDRPKRMRRQTFARLAQEAQEIWSVLSATQRGRRKLERMWG